MSYIHHILKQYWGYNQFRPLQEDIIHSILNNKDTIALLPTGGGKSICYQVPALLMDGICIVVSPLIALMKDQKDNLNKKGIKADAIYSGMSFREIDIVLDNCIYGDTKFLYVSPERLQTPIFKARFEKMNVSFIAVDEAHCISQWGYDFRPEYLEIAKLREIHPQLCFLAVTATATTEVVNDICSKLKFKTNNIYKSNFERANLSLVVRNSEDKISQLISILQKTQGSGIVYANSRNQVREISNILKKNNINADYYHAGLSSKDRTLKQQSWIDNNIRIMVCTNAFGMGIDKPDVRVVVHFEMPQTPEAYYQEAGRAGRDGKKCFAIILNHQQDDEQLLKKIENKYPQFALIRDVYEKICNFLSIGIGTGEYEAHPFDIGVFCENFKLAGTDVLACIKVLETHNYFKMNEGLSESSKLMILLNQAELYKLQVAYPQYDVLINVILRMYGSLFDQLVYIREEDIARKSAIPKDKVTQMLLQLRKINAIDYVERKNGPQLELLHHRVKKQDLIFDVAKLKQLQTNALKRAEKMIEYTSLKHQCRSIYLRSYFEDQQALPCGICDICIEEKNKILNNQKFELMKAHAQDILSSSDKTIYELVALSAQYKESELFQCLRWMIDNKII
ncbi:MAG: RecQ family ATP-dependent DNA helicase, partial [Bacteroidetes bacterium]|nr:RecQ family ATP-dependent DNA helicase [Bacteroidota bacterium]